MSEEKKYLTVSALTRYIKYKFEYDKNLKEILLEGEVSNFKAHSRGHLYFTLKDEGAQIGAMMFSTYAKNINFIPKDGMKVYVRGYVSVYELGGYYQLIVTEMKQSGIGDLYLEFEKLKKELGEKGYFNVEHKKPIPRFPKTVGVITSPTGAVIRDIINTIRRRYPFIKLILYPALVQGAEAKESIVAQINKANLDGLVDVLIVGRGGGSLEDLWAFNEKIVADAIYNSRIPIISAVGHETDFTIADFVADLRAATPTAAAELATPSVIELTKQVNYLNNNLNILIKDYFRNKRLVLANLERVLEQNNPQEKLKDKRKVLTLNYNNLNFLMKHQLENQKNKLILLTRTLNNLSPLVVMNRGYSMTLSDGKALKSVKNIQEGQSIQTILSDGQIISEVKEIKYGK